MKLGTSWMLTRLLVLVSYSYPGDVFYLNPCSQYSVEEPGSYSCLCDETGYQLDFDQTTWMRVSSIINHGYGGPTVVQLKFDQNALVW